MIKSDLLMGVMVVNILWSPLQMEGKTEHEGKPVAVRHWIGRASAEMLTVRFPDGAEYTGYFSLVNLLHPGEQPPPPRPVPKGATSVGQMQYVHLLHRTLVNQQNEKMECNFRYDRANSNAGQGTCLLPSGEKVFLKWN